MEVARSQKEKAASVRESVSPVDDQTWGGGCHPMASFVVASGNEKIARKNRTIGRRRKSRLLICTATCRTIGTGE